MEPIAQSVAARGHEVHVVAPWHPLVARPHGRRRRAFPFLSATRRFRSLNVFGYAAAHARRRQPARRRVRGRAAGARGGLAHSTQIARRHRATVMHGHWVDPRRRHRRPGRAGAAARRQPARLGRLRRRTLRDPRGSRARTRLQPRRVRDRMQRRSRASARRARRDPDRIETVPYGVDTVAVPSRRARAIATAQSGSASAPTCRCALHRRPAGTEERVRVPRSTRCCDVAGRSCSAIAGEGDAATPSSRARPRRGSLGHA